MTRFLRVGSSYVTGAGGGGFAIEPPTASLALVSGALYEGNAATFRVLLSRPWIDDVLVTYATSNGTGSAGTDYTSTSGTATVDAGEDFVDIAVQTTLRAGPQASRTFTLTLTGAEDAAGDPVTITDDAVTVTILDTESEAPTPTLTVAAVASANEGDPLTFRVTASFPFAEDITFSYATSNGTAVAGTDYTAASGLGTIPAETLTDDIAITTALREGYQGPRTVVFTISNAETASEVSAPIGGTGAATGTIAETEALTGDHAYFETLIARTDYWKGMSCRPVSGEPQNYASGPHAGKPNPYYGNQLGKLNQGGYTSGSWTTPYTTYDPSADTDPDAQDAMKVVIPAWGPYTTLAVDLASDGAEMTLTTLTTSPLIHGRDFRIGGSGGEKIKIADTYVITNPRQNPIPILRAQHGTTAQAWPAGTSIEVSQNSLTAQSCIRFPLGTTRGDTYLFTWDAYWTPSYLNAAETHKEFQILDKAGQGAIWFEVQSKYEATSIPEGLVPLDFVPDSHVMFPSLRTYGATAGEPPAGFVGRSLSVLPNEWVRYWIYADHSSGTDTVLMTLWVATEREGPVKIYDEFAHLVRDANNMTKWFVQFNTSKDDHVGANYDRSDDRNLVAYVKNFVALANPDVGDLPALLVRP